MNITASIIKEFQKHAMMMAMAANPVNVDFLNAK